jgi:hypothetical protein
MLIGILQGSTWPESLLLPLSSKIHRLNDLDLASFVVIQNFLTKYFETSSSALLCLISFAEFMPSFIRPNIKELVVMILNRISQNDDDLKEIFLKSLITIRPIFYHSLSEFQPNLFQIVQNTFNLDFFVEVFDNFDVNQEGDYKLSMKKRQLKIQVYSHCLYILSLFFSLYLQFFSQDAEEIQKMIFGDIFEHEGNIIDSAQSSIPFLFLDIFKLNLIQPKFSLISSNFLFIMKIFKISFYSGSLFQVAFQKVIFPSLVEPFSNKFF